MIKQNIILTPTTKQILLQFICQTFNSKIYFYLTIIFHIKINMDSMGIKFRLINVKLIFFLINFNLKITKS